MQTVEEKFLKLRQQQTEANRRYQLKNKERLNEYRKVWYEKNKDSINAKKQEKYNCHKDNPEFKNKNKARSKISYDKKKAQLQEDIFDGVKFPIE